MSKIVILEENTVQSIIDALKPAALEGDTDAAKLVCELKKQLRLDRLRKELFGV